MQQSVARIQILSRGSGPLGSFNLALVGSLHLATGEAGVTSTGDRAKNLAMKSSTMKGAKALESKSCSETVPNCEQSSLKGKGTLLVSCPRNRQLCCAETMLGREVETYGDGLEVGPPSYVTSGTNVITNPGRSIAAALVGRCLVGSEVLEKQWTGRVVRVGAAGSLRLRGLCGRVRCKAVAGSFQCPCGNGHGWTTKGRTGNTRHQQCSLLVGSNAPWEGGQCGHLRLALASGPQVATSGKSARAEKFDGDCV